MYIYQADTYCDSCGEAIRESLRAQGKAPEREADESTYDSDDFPKGPFPAESTDSPDHCAQAEVCLESLDLREYGLGKRATMHGAETLKIGALLSDGLTADGVAWLRDTLRERCRTPYQRALHRFWRAAFADEL